MGIKEFHYDFKLKKDKIDSLQKRNFNRAEIDWLINEAILTFTKTRISGLNVHRTGVEESQKRMDDLSTLNIKFPIQPLLVPENAGNNTFILELEDLSYPYYHYLRGWANTPICSNISLRPTQQDDLNDAQDDPFNESSASEFIRFNFGKGRKKQALFIYSNDEITGVCIEYYKLPQRVHYGGYTSLDGILTNATDSDLPDHTHNEIVNLAVTIAESITENPNYQAFKQYADSSE